MAHYSNLQYPFHDGRQGKTGTKRDYNITGRDVQELLAGHEPAVQADMLTWLGKQSHAPLKSVVRTKLVQTVQKYAHSLQTA